MGKVIAINGSPTMEKGTTALILAPFLEGMRSAGAEVELVYASRLNIQPCSCGRMVCWNKTPGECCLRDDMDTLYSKLRQAEAVVLATPVYIPLPGAMANFINRLCPLLDPTNLQFIRGRTRAKMRAEVAIRSFALVCTSGWWEKANCATVVRVVRELALDTSVGFGGALLRPHASALWRKGAAVEAVLAATHRAGEELARDGVMNPATLREASRVLVRHKDW